MSSSPTAAQRRGSKAALFPLAVMAATFFIPSYRACSDPFQSPAQFASDGWFEAAWISPVYVFAALFAVLTGLALRSGEVSRATRRLGLLTLAVFSAATLLCGAAGVLQGEEWQWLAVGVVTSTAAAVLVRRARGRDPWQVWEHLLAAFAIIAAGSMPTIFLAGDILLNAGSSSGPGAYLFVGAQAALWLVLAVSLFKARFTATGRGVRG